MRPLRLLALALVLGAAIASFSLLPSSARSMPAMAGHRAPIRGAMHIHTRRSDGTGTVDQVAAAAARAGLSFVIITDHGNLSRELEPPSYRSGVLCIEAVEISTKGGHVVALGLSKSPYPLGGEPRDVVDDIARLGGMSIAAHPTSSKADLRWRDWSAPIDGIEWLNGDSEWRDERAASLGRTLLTYPFRQAETLASLLDRPDAALSAWDKLASDHPVVAVAASDAHARIGFRSEGDPFEPRIALHLPAYEQAFRAFSISIPGVALGHDAATDARAVVDAIRHGHVFSSIDGLASPAIVAFTAESGGVSAQGGDTLRAGNPATFSLESNAPSDARVRLLRNGVQVADVTGPKLMYVGTEAGAYRVEIYFPHAPGVPPIPWIVTNPIYLSARGARPVEKADSAAFTSRYDDGPADEWHVEKSANSEGAINVVRTIGGTQLSLRFGLGGMDGESPFVGFVMPAGSIVGADRLAFSATASRPMRMSVQLRTPDGAAAKRWQRSIYLDETKRSLVVPFGEMTPLGAASDAHPIVERVSDVLFVVDTVNAGPGSNGQIWLDDVKYGR